MKRDSLVLTTCLALAVSVSALAFSYPLQKESLDTTAPYAYVPDTVSLRAQQVLRQMKGPQGLPLPAPDDVEGWKKIRNYVPPQLKEIFKENTEAALKRYPDVYKRQHQSCGYGPADRDSRDTTLPCHWTAGARVRRDSQRDAHSTGAE